jgi:hypothetical protein
VPPWAGLRLRSISATLPDPRGGGSGRAASPSAGGLSSTTGFNSSSSGPGAVRRPVPGGMKPVLQRWSTFAAGDYCHG